MMGALLWRKEIQRELRPLEEKYIPKTDSFQSYLKYYSLERFAPHLNVGLISQHQGGGKWCAWEICIDEKAPYALVVHGLFDHSAYMAPLFSTLIECQLNILVLDLPGHGLSSGELLESRDFFEYGEQNLAAKDWLERHQKKLFVEIAHSTGAVGVFQSAIAQKQAPHIVLLNPLVKTRHFNWIKKFVKPASKILSTIPRKKKSSNPNRDFVKFRLNDPLQPWYVTLKWAKDYLYWLERFEQEQALKMESEVLVLQGKKDSTVDPERSFALIQRLLPNVQRDVFNTLGHQLLNAAPEETALVLKKIRKELSLWHSNWIEDKS